MRLRIQGSTISIHASLTGSDSEIDIDFNDNQLFQSTLPLRGATTLGPGARPQTLISIHASLTGSDPTSSTKRTEFGDFNPRFPYGERLLSLLGMIYPLTFQSTLPLRGATVMVNFVHQNTAISIHASLTGSDQGGTRCVCRPVYFNPRFPYGERHITAKDRMPKKAISIHASLTGSDKQQHIYP